MDMTYTVKTASGISPIEAGYGLVYAGTIAATTDDELILDRPGCSLELNVDSRKTTGYIAELGLKPGLYDAHLSIFDNKELVEERHIRLLVAHPMCVVHKFGARYGSLSYDMPVVTGKGGRTAHWDDLWKTGEVSDIVVDFDKPYKFVFWRGMSYAPSWAADNIMTSLFFAETMEIGLYRDCCEMMSDRECRYSHVRVVQNTEARVVVHWRCALCDPTYEICRDQWADEMYYIYPDGLVCRTTTIYIDPEDCSAWKNDEVTGKRLPNSMIGINNGGRTFNDTEFVSVNPAGSRPEDNLLPGAITLMDCDGFSETYIWPSPPDFSQTPLPELSEYIFRINYRNRPGVFLASHPENMSIVFNPDTGVMYVAGATTQDDSWLQGVRTVDSSVFASYIHWPVTRGYGTTVLTDAASFLDRPTHTYLGAVNNAPVEIDPNGAATWVWLTGIAPEDETTLRSKVRAWSRPVEIDGAVYDSKQRAYVFENAEGRTQITVCAAEEIAQPSFIIKGWGNAVTVVDRNGVRLGKDKVKTGVESYLDRVQAVVTFNDSLQPGDEIVLENC